MHVRFAEILAQWIATEFVRLGHTTGSNSAKHQISLARILVSLDRDKLSRRISNGDPRIQIDSHGGRYIFRDGKPHVAYTRQSSST
jgi:hypothetical protein